MWRKVWTVAAALVVAASVAYLIILAVGATASYYVTVAEATQQAEALARRALRVQGQVVPGTVQWDLAQLELRFLVADPARPSERLAVVYRGARPDGLEEGKTVIVEGRLSGHRTLQASAIMVQCPSRYEVEVSKLNWGGR